MKRRHAAMLSLVGWYLMMPTPYGHHDLRYVEKLPLSQWTVSQSFESADDCENVLFAMRKSTRKDLESIPLNQDINAADGSQRLAFFYTQAQCIASDDPRLKEK